MTTGHPKDTKKDMMDMFEGVVPVLSQALQKRGYSVLTPVQKAVLDSQLEDQDLLVSAQTGSGKTVAFGLAMAKTLLGDDGAFEQDKMPVALIIAPTRELALQVKRELEWLYESSGGTVISCVGGMDIRAEQKALQHGADIIVGTPGRLCDHIKRGFFDPGTLKAVVLDEADEMLDMGFREELEYILDTTPEGRRTLLFSATVPKTISSLAKRYQNNAIRVTTKEEEKQHLDIEYQALVVAPSDRENAIINLMRFHEAKNTIIFCGTRLAVNHLTSRLTNRGFSVVSLSGELNQSQRSHALQALRDGRAQVCVATDVAARGIDLPDLELVIHADMPKNQDLLLHRSGRTGRAGRKGISALIVPHNWRSRVERLLRHANIQAAWGAPPSIADIEQRDRERFLADPALSEPVKEEELAFAQEILATYGAEQVAAAVLRLYSAQKPAPEELLDTAEPEAGKRDRRENFQDSVWVSLSVGRKDNAEPRWLLPMLCEKGRLTRHQIGAIRIDATETYVELSADSIDKFLKHVGATGKIEKNIGVTLLDDVAEMQAQRIDRSNRPKRSKERKSEPPSSNPAEQHERPSYEKSSEGASASANVENAAEERKFKHKKKKQKKKSNTDGSAKRHKKDSKKDSKVAAVTKAGFKKAPRKGKPDSTHPAVKRKKLKNNKKR